MQNETIAEKKVLEKSNTQEVFGQSKPQKFNNWYKTKCLPVLKKAVSKVKMPGWRVILVLVILAYMAKNGAMDDMPNIKWAVESMVRLTDWFFGVIRSICQWAIGNLDSNLVNATDFFGIVEKFVNWVKGIYAL